ncbi:MAG: hypothetical protein IKX39_04410 [Muribaculaceae bacterium]|nr:hypothetical protein [Muribaculaceae bacterium]
MNDTHSHQEQEFVPEVDAASLQGATLPPSPPPVPPEPLAPTLSDDPEQAMKQLPAALAEHIQDLLAQADAEGYLRGRNEIIEATQHFHAPDDSELTLAAPIPRYNHSSIWDL